MGNWLVVVVECGHCGGWKMKRLVFFLALIISTQLRHVTFEVHKVI